MNARSVKTREGLRKAAQQGRVPGAPQRVTDAQIRKVMHLGTAEAARKVGLTKAWYIQRRRRIEEGRE